MQKIMTGKISISKADTVGIVFRVDGYSMAEDDTTIFSIRQNGMFINQSLVVYSGEAKHDEKYIYVDIPAETMKEIPAGSYIYDVLLKTASGRTITLNYPRQLKIMEVAHDEQ